MWLNGADGGTLCRLIIKKQQQEEQLIQNKHLGNRDYYVIIASSSHPLFLTEHAANGLVEAPLK